MDKKVLLSELKFKAVRSSGAGGQNVNKVSSKVVLSFDLGNSLGLTHDEKELLLTKIATKLTQENILILTSEEDRSQLKNKEVVVKKFLKVIENGLKIPKERKETRIPRAVKEKRLSTKKVIGLLKQNRKKPNF
ncbi:alternative ribosome rescue aminoacyl-tRNA hydrolase ArfB [Flavobacterium sp. N2820]|jgi:ribosome-associated protein|uniref:alternative ribosome rescue aminoacyl-tRNA hydrolase ArfB n=1 Tax=Flavobacterium sp. N2820 TaxID=2986834 RepID=UPI0022252232|nr:alternative ribosome rescue aminoacyl-tRNA hydrolase ArfB [Flavobacterium sp. N2820]